MWWRKWGAIRSLMSPLESMIVNEMLASPMGEGSAYGRDESAINRTLYGLLTYPAKGIKSKCNPKWGPIWVVNVKCWKENVVDRTLKGLPTYLDGRIMSDVVQRRAQAGWSCVSVKNAKIDDCEWNAMNAVMFGPERPQVWLLMKYKCRGPKPSWVAYISRRGIRSKCSSKKDTTRVRA